MSLRISIFLTCIFLLSGLFDNMCAQTVIGTFSDTIYLLSVFHNSGEKDNKAENYYCAVFLDKKSDIEGLLSLKTTKSVYVPCDTSDILVKKNWYVRTDAKTEKRIAEEIETHFVANPCIGGGMAIITACGQYLNGKVTTFPYYSFITDTVFKSEMVKKHPMTPDMLMGEITDPLVTGGLMIGWCDDSDAPLGAWIFDYEEKGTYCKLFKLEVDYLLFDDPSTNILGKSYEWVIHPGTGKYEGTQNVRLLLGDVGSPFISHLKVFLKDGQILTALPYSVKNLTKE